MRLPFAFCLNHCGYCPRNYFLFALPLRIIIYKKKKNVIIIIMIINCANSRCGIKCITQLRMLSRYKNQFLDEGVDLHHDSLTVTSFPAKTIGGFIQRKTERRKRVKTDQFCDRPRLCGFRSAASRFIRCAKFLPIVKKGFIRHCFAEVFCTRFRSRRSRDFSSITH